MTQNLTVQLKKLLAVTGYAVTEGFPAGPSFRPEAITLAALVKQPDPGRGLFQTEIRVLSPGKQGAAAAWNAAAKTVDLLYRAGFSGETGTAEYLNAGDCWCIPVRAALTARKNRGAWELINGISVHVGTEEIPHLKEFTARQDFGRRLIRPVCQSLPAGITPEPAAGWEIRLVQGIQAGENLPDPVPEPFSVKVVQNQREISYLGCGWTAQEIRVTPEESVLERRGFALSREVQHG